MSSKHRHKKLLSPKLFILKWLRYSGWAAILLLFSLSLGMGGYMHYGKMGYIDAFLNASMILTGMGPIDEMTTNPAKIFAGFYAIYSGVAFLSTVAVFLAPVLHRFMHLLHLDIQDDNEENMNN